MDPANSEVGGTVSDLRRGPVECWSVLEVHGLEVRGVPRASLGVGLRGAGAGIHTG